MVAAGLKSGALALAVLFSPEALAVPQAPRRPAVAPALIRVLLGTYNRFSVSGYDLDLNGSIRLTGSSAFNVRCGSSSNGIAFVEFGAGRRAHGKLEISAPGGFLQMNDRPYRARFVIYPRGAKCTVVNVLELEKYLAGVITKEMSPSWPLEALKAQAVASRSYANFQIHSNRGREYDVESGTQDQVYDGSGYETARSHQAVEATRGMALVYAENPLKAYFHANCGGITEVPEFVWGGEAKSFRSVVCPHHRRPRDRSRWSLRLSREQIEGALRKITGLLPRSFLRVAVVEAGAPDASQRLSDLSVSDGSGNSLLVSANAFRNAVGNTRLKSTSFQISKAPEGYVFEGEGYGHGVGMCQVGARSMAEEGKTYEQILQFYYPLAKIRSVL